MKRVTEVGRWARMTGLARLGALLGALAGWAGPAAAQEASGPLLQALPLHPLLRQAVTPVHSDAPAKAPGDAAPPATEPVAASTPAALDAAPAAPAAFDVQIDAPADLAALLGQHLELMRYRALNDLSGEELDRLIDSARSDARELLATQGFFRPDVQISRQTPPGAARAQVHLIVHPGAAVRVHDVRLLWQGAIAPSQTEADPELAADAGAQRARILSTWDLPAGRVFTQAGWDAAKRQALALLTEHAYPLGQIAASEADIDPEAGLARLRLTLDSGPRFRLGQLSTSGLSRHPAELVLRLARLPWGQAFDLQTLADAQQRLAESGYFDAAYLSLVPQSEPQNALVLANLREAPLQKLTLGAGVSTDAGPRLSLEHLHQRMPLLGWRAHTTLTLERDAPSLNTDWLSPPRADGWRGLAGLRLQAQTLDGERLDSQRVRGGVLKNEAAFDRAMYVQYDRADTVADLNGQRSVAQALSAHYAITLRRFDALPVARAGWGLSAEIGAGQTLDTQPVPFTRALARAQAYWPLSRLWPSAAAADAGVRTLEASRLAVRAQLGAVLTRDGTQLPQTQLFLAGGDASVRGYAPGSLGVPRSDGRTVAARYLAVGSLEWQRPIRWAGQLTRWESDVFIDAGSVADSVPTLRAHWGVGAGARWLSPVGPLQIDLAYAAQERRWRLHLNVGFVF